MPSEKFRITTNGQSLRNPSNGFFGMTLSANMTLDESDVSAHNDRRSAHNALERQRREHLNVKFQQLAHALPALQTVRRPSKTMIVAKSLEFVSSSLKREDTYLTEIQKLRLENEKLRKQAENSSQQLKKQVNQEVEQKSLKRKASSDSQQLSPPPTPENTKEKEILQPKSKKRMLKQTKSLPSEPVVKSETPATQLLSQQQQPWSPLLDSLTTTTYPPTLSPPNYFDTSSNSSPIHHDLLYTNMYHTTAMQHGQQQQQTNYHSMMNPMLLSPYFCPTASNPNENTEVSFTSRDHYYM